MTASGMRTSSPFIWPRFTYAVMGLAAVSLLLTGFAIGSSRATSQQAALPGVAALTASAAIPPVAVAPIVRAAGSHLVSESFAGLTQPRPRSIGATGPTLLRSASLPTCGPGIVVADAPAVVAHGPGCTFVTGQRPADEGVDVLTHGRQPTRNGGPPASAPRPAPGSHF